MQDSPHRNLLEDKLLQKESEAEAYRLQADTALKYAEQVWWSWNLRRKRLKIRSIGDCILGYRMEDLDREDPFWWNRMHPEDLKAIQDSLRLCLDGEEPVWHCQHRLLDVSGDWVWVEQTGFVQRRDPNGRPIEMVGTTRKIEEIFQLLEIIQGSDAIISALARNSPLRFCLRDPDGRLLLVSDALKEEFSHPFTSSAPEDQLSASDEDRDVWRQGFQRAFHGQRTELDLALVAAPGLKRRFAIHLVPVKEHDRIFSVLELFIPRGD